MKKYEHLEAKAKEAVDRAKSFSAIEARVITNIDWYRTDEEALMLRDMLWYAKYNGVNVVFISPTNEK